MARGDNKVKFTDDNVKTLKPIGGKRTFYTDTLVPGLSIRVSPTGHRSYSFQYRAGRTQERVTIGDIRKTTLAGARETARNLLRGGANPAEQKRKNRLLAVKGDPKLVLFSDLCDSFVRAESEYWTKSTKDGWVRYIEKEIKPAFGPKAAEAVTADDVVDLIQGIQGRAPVSAQRCFEVIRKLCRWALKKRLLTVDPTVAAAPDTREDRRRRRKRAPLKPYSDEQLRGIFEAARGTEMEHLIEFVARTGVRSHEARSARRKDIRNDMWTIPAELHKNGSRSGMPHLVPLSRQATRLVKNISDDLTWLFPAETLKCKVCPYPGHMDPPKAGTIVAGIKEAGAVEGRGLLHRLRDTIKTRMTENLIDTRVSEHILGHLVLGVDGIYNHAELLPQRKEALQWWSDELDRILKGGKKR